VSPPHLLPARARGFRRAPLPAIERSLASGRGEGRDAGGEGGVYAPSRSGVNSKRIDLYAAK